MSYHDFLNSLVSPISNFINWLGTISNTLLSNYIVITILGLALFVSMFYLVLDLINLIKLKHKNYNDDYSGKNYKIDRGGK